MHHDLSRSLGPFSIAGPSPPLTLATAPAGVTHGLLIENDRERLRAGSHQGGGENANSEGVSLRKALRADNSAEASLREAVGQSAEESGRKVPRSFALTDCRAPGPGGLGALASRVECGKQRMVGMRIELRVERKGQTIFRAECDTERGSGFAEFSKFALREFNQRHPEVSLLDDDVWLKFDTVR
jgi:hypothetical protein